MPRSAHAALLGPAALALPLLLPLPARAQDAPINPCHLDTGFILLVTDKTGRASAQSPIYLAGHVNGWNPGDPRFRLEPQSDMKWRIHLTPSMLKGTQDGMEFKFTRGEWTIEELNADFTTPGNKVVPTLPVSSIKPGQPPVLEYTILAWSDTSPNAASPWIGEAYTPVPARGTLKRIQVLGGAGDARGKPRDLLAWLPPGYDDPANASRRYSVLYLHDGQNLFHAHAGIPAEWGADETATDLIAAGLAKPFIIVGVPHAGASRVAEYMPAGMGAPVLAGRTPEADAHLDWLITHAMPRVERTLRVATGPDETGIGGSSLGGLLSLYAAARHPDIFGLVLAESPSLSIAADSPARLFDQARPLPRRVYLGVGGREVPSDAVRSERYQAAVADAAEQLRSAGLPADRLHLEVAPQAEHTERAWAARLPEALRFLFPPR